MTNLIDIYEAAGAKVNKDRTAVELPPSFNSFEIVLRVIPAAISFQDGGKPEMTFSIMIEDGFRIEDGDRVRWIEYSEEFTMPVNQVRLLEKE